MTHWPEDMETFRMDRGWPTPFAMRQAADGLDKIAIPRYGEILRWVADLCDDSLDPTEEVDALREAAEYALAFMADPEGLEHKRDEWRARLRAALARGEIGVEAPSEKPK